MKPKSFVVLLLLACISGCYAGTVKPLLEQPEFQVENRPVRTLRILALTDGTFRDGEIETFVSKSSRLMEAQVGVRLEISGRQQIKWGKEFNQAGMMLLKIAAETWKTKDSFDVAVVFSYFNITDVTKVSLGIIDPILFRYMIIRELDSTVFLHELFHAFLLEHSEDGMMRSVKPAEGDQWYWLTPAERKQVLRNKWRDFNVAPAIGKEQQKNLRESALYYYVGMSFCQKGEYEQALSLFNKCLELNPKFAPAHNDRGNIYSRQERYAEAIADYNKALEIDPVYSPAYYSLGRISDKKGDLKQAIAYFSKAIETNERYDLAYANLAWLFATAKESGLRNGKKAVELALKACELSNWEQPTYLDTLAAAYARAGDFDKAVRWQKKVLESSEYARDKEAKQRLDLYRERKAWPLN